MFEYMRNHLTFDVSNAHQKRIKSKRVWHMSHINLENIHRHITATLTSLEKIVAADALIQQVQIILADLLLTF